MTEPQIVPCPGSFHLHSRVVRLHTGTSYRDIVIHEMTETEIDGLKLQRIAAVLIGVAIGLLVSWLFIDATVAKYCQSLGVVGAIPASLYAS